MDLHSLDGLERLTARLPLGTRQRALPAPSRELHRAILVGLCRTGAPPAREELARIVAPAPLDDALQALNGLDLIILRRDGTVAGAYPLTTETTPHRCTIGDVTIHAMCALDALAVAPMFGTAVEVASRCHVTGRELAFGLESERLLRSNAPEAMVGIEWSRPEGHAAHSLCLNMLFLADAGVAAAWCRDGDRSAYRLDQAIDFGSRFFSPLLD